MARKATTDSQTILVFVEKVSGGYITAIEGNKHNVCARRTIRVGDGTIRGYARPKYSGATAVPVSKPAPAPAAAKPAAKPSSGIVCDGIWGPATTRGLQRLYGTPQDGIVSNQYPWSNFKSAVSGFTFVSTNPAGSLLIAKIQASLGIKPADGLMGPGTIKAMQKKLGTPADGIISAGGSSMVVAMQKKINAGVKPF
jgi:hypothetical protein